MTDNNGRNSDGTFAAGNPGGSGRPRRAVEREYLAALADVASLEAWREICQRAVEDAKQGNPKARAWLSNFLLGPEPLRPLDLAADELENYGAAEEVKDRSFSRKAARSDARLGDCLAEYSAQHKAAQGGKAKIR
jgi:hypothetical protein